MKQPEGSPAVIGIDLGTTYSLCSVLTDGLPRLLPNALGEVLTPSAVSVDEAGEVLVGAAARARAAAHPAMTALGFKRDMGTDKLMRLGSHGFRPEQLSALVLAELKRDAEHALGRPVEEAVITVPAYFGELQRAATRAAGEIAGLRVERIINEPTAAALAYGLHAKDRDLRAIVLDLGGSTFDVTVLQIEAGVIEVQSSAGDVRLGGDDFVEALVRQVIHRVQTMHRLELESDRLAMARVRTATEQVKRALSTQEHARLSLNGLRVGREQIDVDLNFSRAECEQVWAPLLSRLLQPIRRALRDARITAEELDEVLMVGGASRIPCVVEQFASVFGRAPSRSLPADEAVAMGAAVQAALRSRDTAVEDLVVTDVAPFSLGVSTATRFAQTHVAGLFSPILDRGTVIPASRSITLSTISDGQTEVVLEVFQGEHSLCQENTKLGEYRIREIPPHPAGRAAIEVRFTYDLNGLLEVESTVLETGAKHALVIEQRPGGLSAKQIAAAREAMKRLKHHPRELLPNRAALARAEALFLELTGIERQMLGAAISALRVALETQDRALIDTTRARTIALTDQLNRPCPSAE